MAGTPCLELSRVPPALVTPPGGTPWRWRTFSLDGCSWGAPNGLGEVPRLIQDSDGEHLVGVGVPCAVWSGDRAIE